MTSHYVFARLASAWATRLRLLLVGVVALAGALLHPGPAFAASHPSAGFSMTATPVAQLSDTQIIAEARRIFGAEGLDEMFEAVLRHEPGTRAQRSSARHLARQLTVNLADGQPLRSSSMDRLCAGLNATAGQERTTVSRAAAACLAAVEGSTGAVYQLLRLVGDGRLDYVARVVLSAAGVDSCISLYLVGGLLRVGYVLRYDYQTLEHFLGQYLDCRARPQDLPDTTPVPPRPTPGPRPGGTGGGQAPPVDGDVLVVAQPSDVDRVRNRIADAEPDLDPEDARRAARTCVDQEIAALEVGVEFSVPNPCEALPLYFPGADVGEVAEHNADAIAQQPAWFQLHYQPERLSPYDPRWYNAVAFRDSCPMKRAERNVHCDEFPYRATVEGGPGASLREVHVDHNRREGTLRGRMYADTRCNMRSNPGAQQAFLVIPLAQAGQRADIEEVTYRRYSAIKRDEAHAYAGPNTFHVCSGALAPALEEFPLDPSFPGGGGGSSVT